MSMYTGVGLCASVAVSRSVARPRRHRRRTPRLGLDRGGVPLWLDITGLYRGPVLFGKEDRCNGPEEVELCGTKQITMCSLF